MRIVSLPLELKDTPSPRALIVAQAFLPAPRLRAAYAKGPRAPPRVERDRLARKGARLLRSRA